MNAIVLVAPPHDPAIAEPFFTALLGDGWTVNAYSDQGAVPDDIAAKAEFIIAALAPCDRSLFARCPNLRLIQVPGHGYDHVNVGDASAGGVPVATVASSGAEAHTVAEWALLMAGAASRRLVAGHVALAGGEWANLTQMQAGVFELSGKTMGIIGLGRIGRELAPRARAFGMPVIYHDIVRPDPETERALDVSYRDLDELLATSDFISLHVPSTSKTRGMIGAAAIEKMKPEVIIVNTARGDIIDHDALVDALSRNRIRGAALDVFEPEPPPSDDPLLSLPNVLVSPHQAGVTAESLVRILQAAAANCNRAAQGEEPHDIVGPDDEH